MSGALSYNLPQLALGHWILPKLLKVRDVVGLRMTSGTQSNQVLLRVAPQVTAERHVVHLKVLHAAAGLAPPAIAFKNLSM
jgi:hypothetical protein